jgi:hypothetical protein
MLIVAIRGKRALKTSSQPSHVSHLAANAWECDKFLLIERRIVVFASEISDKKGEGFQLLTKRQVLLTLTVSKSRLRTCKDKLVQGRCGESLLNTKPWNFRP